MQIEEAIREVDRFKEEDIHLMLFENTNVSELCYLREAIDTVLNYIETMQSEFDRLEGIEDNAAMLKKELEEQTESNKELNKVLIHFKAVINEMAGALLVRQVIFKEGASREDIKEYFSKKVEENK